MKCQILFSGKNRKNIINLSSAELAQRMVKVNLTCLLQYLGQIWYLFNLWTHPSLNLDRIIVPKREVKNQE